MINTYACEYCGKITPCDCKEHQEKLHRTARLKDQREQRAKSDAKARKVPSDRRKNHAKSYS